MTTQSIHTCPECTDGRTVDHVNSPSPIYGRCDACDGQHSWEGDWRCNGCDMVIDTADNYCPCCEEVTSVYAGPQREWHELSATQLMKEMAA